MSEQPPKLLIHGKHLLTMPESPDALSQYAAHTGDLASRDAEITGLIEDGAVLVEDGKITWFGEFRRRPKRAKKEDVLVFETGTITPGWIDCHTHAVFAGHRADEFMLRNAGRPYVEILEAGGGILNTVDAVRDASTDELASALIRDTFEFIRRGVTTLEVKSGYGLTTQDERKQLRAIEEARAEVPCELVSCFLGAHAIPREYRDDRDAYVDLVCKEMIPMVASEKLATHCDVFCDRGAFTVEEARRVLETGREYGLTPRIHADEIQDIGAVKMATEVGCTSADHLEHTKRDALEAMASANVTGVLMPAVNLFLGTTSELAPARELLNVGGEVALATDYNPGSAMTYDLGWMLTLGCTLYKLTPGEALRAVTIGAAKALGRQDLGRIREGATANLTMLDVPSPSYIPYHAGANHVEGVIWQGNFVYWTESEPA